MTLRQDFIAHLALIPTKDLGLRAPARLTFPTLADICEQTEYDLLKIRGVTKAQLKEVKRALVKEWLAFGGAGHPTYFVSIHLLAQALTGPVLVRQPKGAHREQWFAYYRYQTKLADKKWAKHDAWVATQVAQETRREQTAQYIIPGDFSFFVMADERFEKHERWRVYRDGKCVATGPTKMIATDRGLRAQSMGES